MSKKNTNGFTLLEAVAAISILALAVALAMTGYVHLLKNSNESEVQHELDVDVQKAIERLKADLRLSSLDEIFYYSTNGVAPYTAISFPMAEIDPSTGRIYRNNTTGEITWRKTVIYHIRPGSPDQLVRTEFSPRDNTITQNDRKEQLDETVGDGYGTSTHNGQNASSRVIFSNLVDWKLDPRQGEFTCYADQADRIEPISLGYVLLDQGDHTITFTSSGKHPDSNGYALEIDQLLLTPSYHFCEAENLTVSEDPDGLVTKEQSLVAENWHKLRFQATDAPGTDITDKYFTLAFENDEWEETNFRAFAEADKTKAVTETSPMDNVIKLEGNDITWEAESQSGDYTGTSKVSNHLTSPATLFRVLLKGKSLLESGDYLATSGNRVRLTFSRGTGSNRMTIRNVYIAESSSPTNSYLTYPTGLDLTVSNTVFFNGSDQHINLTAGETCTSEWTDIPIDAEKNYLVTYQVEGDTQYWEDSRVAAGSISRYTQRAILLTGPDATTQARVTNWNSLNTNEVTLTTSSQIHALKQVEVRYAAEGTFTSGIFDTMDDQPTFSEVTWNKDLPSGTDIDIKVRSGGQPDLSDASDWDLITPYTGAVMFGYKRYIQFQAILTSNSDNTETPTLKDVSIKWNGQRRMVNIQGMFTKGRTYGDFSLTVDGKPLQSSLMVDLQIYKDLTRSGKRATSSIRAELSPRNSGLY